MTTRSPPSPNSFTSTRTVTEPPSNHFVRKSCNCMGRLTRIMRVSALPPRLSSNRRVSLLSRKGTWLRLSTMALMTRPRASRPRLMDDASVCRAPSEPLRATDNRRNTEGGDWRYSGAQPLSYAAFHALSLFPRREITPCITSMRHGHRQHLRFMFSEPLRSTKFSREVLVTRDPAGFTTVALTCNKP